jgi:hypothetical protein
LNIAVLMEHILYSEKICLKGLSHENIESMLLYIIWKLFLLALFTIYKIKVLWKEQLTIYV